MRRYGDAFTAGTLGGIAIAGLLSGALLAGFHAWILDRPFQEALEYGAVSGLLISVATLLGNLTRTWLDRRHLRRQRLD